MYSSLSGLPRVLLALLLVLRFPGEKAAGPPAKGGHTELPSDPITQKITSVLNVICIRQDEEEALILFRKHFSCCTSAVEIIKVISLLIG